jgi:hypothetical protein
VTPDHTVPFGRITESLPTQVTGETRLVDDRGRVWTERMPGEGFSSGSTRGRVVNGYMIPETDVITVRSEPAKEPPPPRSLNRHERRKLAAESRGK